MPAFYAGAGSESTVKPTLRNAAVRLAEGGENLRILRLTGVIPIDGGVPVIMDGKVVGAIGVSGGAGQQDGQVARVGASVVR